MHESLRESAAQFAARLLDAVKGDYSCLCDELWGRYGWCEPASTTHQWLADLKQGSNSLVEHAQEVRKLVTRAYPDVDPRMQDQYAAKTFARGLRNCRIAFLVVQQALVSCWGPTLLATLKINGKPVQATVDTGTIVTILSQDFFKQLGITEDGNRFAVRLSDAEDRQDMDATGGVVVKMEIGSCKMEWNVHVAPIHDDVLLGLDFLRAADVTIRA